MYFKSYSVKNKRGKKMKKKGKLFIVKNIHYNRLITRAYRYVHI